MKRTFRSILAAGTAATLLACGTAAMAADTQPAPQIAVQLDGQELSFSDALPQVKNGRTYVPFRAVFEALGAEVSYSGSTITAKRDGRTVTMTTGSQQVSISEDGSTRTLDTDAAPYVDSTSWRTYVPLRFAAEAFDCAVGWDDDTRTAIIIDLVPMLETAMDGRQYTYLQKYMDYSQQFNEGIWDSEVSVTGSMSVTDEGKSATIPITVSAGGTTADSSKMDLKMTMSMDLSSAIAALAESDPAEVAQLAMLNAVFKEGLDVQLRGDLSRNVLYMAMTGKALEGAGLPAGTWYKMDLAELTDGVGVISSSSGDGPTVFFSAAGTEMPLTALNSSDPVDLLTALIELDGVDSVSDYAKIKDAVEYVAGLLADSSFVKDGNDLVLTVTPEGDIPEESGKLVLTLSLKNDKVVGYAVELTAKVDGEDPESMSVRMAVDADNKVSGEMSMALGSEADAQFEISGQYKKGTAAPVTEPPASASVLPFELLLDSVPKGENGIPLNP